MQNQPNTGAHMKQSQILGGSFRFPFLKGNKATIIFDRLPVQKSDLEKIKKWIDLFGESLVEEKAVRYNINYTKAIETILWLIHQKPGIDVYHIGKAVFYAEKYHLNRYARPIIGDSYQKGKYGPFPSTIIDIIQQNSTLIPKRQPNLDFFSATDIECLKEALNIVEKMSFDDLKNMSHEEESFMDAIEKGQLDYELLIDENNPLKNDVINEMRENCRYVCV